MTCELKSSSSPLCTGSFSKAYSCNLSMTHALALQAPMRTQVTTAHQGLAPYPVMEVSALPLMAAACSSRSEWCTASSLASLLPALDGCAWAVREVAGNAGFHAAVRAAPGHAFQQLITPLLPLAGEAMVASGLSISQVR
jgi:hypothetical protein